VWLRFRTVWDPQTKLISSLAVVIDRPFIEVENRIHSLRVESLLKQRQPVFSIAMPAGKLLFEDQGKASTQDVGRLFGLAHLD
jgi:hypothetical protein